MEVLEEIYNWLQAPPWKGDNSDVLDFLSSNRYIYWDNILDVGCWLGDVAGIFTESPYMSYLGIDISSNAIKKCRNTFRDYMHISFKNIDIWNFFSEKKFSCILDIWCLHLISFEKQKQILEKYDAMLESKGVLYIRFFHNPNEINAKPLFFDTGLTIFWVSEKMIISLFQHRYSIIKQERDIESYDICSRNTLILYKK